MKDFYSNNDKVFREKISSHEFKFDSSAWDKMEKMLDDEDPRKVVAWRYPYMMIILGIFFVGITFLSPTTDSNEVAKTIAETGELPTNITADSATSIESDVVTSTAFPKESKSKVDIKTTKKSIVNILPNKVQAFDNAIIEEPTKNNTTSIISDQNIIPSIIKSTPIEAVKNYIETIQDTPEKRENIQAFMEVNSLLQPVKYDQTIVSTLPLEAAPILLKKKKMKVGVQAGASVILAKRSLADQGKIATAVGGFINLDIDSKNTIAFEANYKNGFSKATILTPNRNERSNFTSQSGNGNPNESFDSYVQKAGYVEVNNIERVHAIEIPVIYKRKLGKRNSVIAGVKPSLLMFKNSSELDGDGAALGDFSNDSTSKMILDLGLVAGLEHQINKNLGVDLRYNQGILDISSIDEVRNTNSELALTVKYTF